MQFYRIQTYDDSIINKSEDEEDPLQGINTILVCKGDRYIPIQKRLMSEYPHLFEGGSIGIDSDNTAYFFRSNKESKECQFKFSNGTISKRFL